MKRISTLPIIAASLIAGACSGGQETRSLVLYYSQTGTTQAVAEEIQRLTGADIEAIEIENPYDGDYGATIARVQQERAEGIVQTLKTLNVKIEDYDIIYLGYPVWFGTYAPPVAALLQEHDFAGRKVVPFCTFGSGGIEASSRDMAAAIPEAVIAEGYGVRTARIGAAPAEIERFLKEGGYIEGSIAPLPGYSAQQPAGDSEKAIFDAACGDYQFPLGTPVSFGTRTTESSVDYRFEVDNGTTIYVTVPGDGTRPMFTRVVR